MRLKTVEEFSKQRLRELEEMYRSCRVCKNIHTWPEYSSTHAGVTGSKRFVCSCGAKFGYPNLNATIQHRLAEDLKWYSEVLEGWERWCKDRGISHLGTN